MKLVLSVDGHCVVRRFGGGDLGVALPDLPAADRDAPGACSAIDALTDWAGRYCRAVEGRSDPAMVAVGREMFDWLDQGGALAEWLAGSRRELEVRVDPTQVGALAEALLAAPWEILCRHGLFLAAEHAPFVVARRCGGTDEPHEPQHCDLSLMFMAAAPEDGDNLDFEREEAAILKATQAQGDRPPLAHVQVEESGALEFLAERLTYDASFDVLHLSCHGTIVSDGAGARPVLLFETAEGSRDTVDPGRLTREIYKMPPMVFLSACRTAERGAGRGLPHREGHRDGFAESQASWSDMADLDVPDASMRGEAGSAEPAPDLADPFARQLAREVPNVLGWDGSVFDTDATAFAEAFYGALSRGETVPMAAARARQALLKLGAEDPRLGRHWHLARLYLGPGGGGRICDPQKERRKVPPSGETVFLDLEAKLVPVAGPEEFVGRRRAIQRVIRAYREGARGVVVHGMGNLGKSSLAARVAGRMRQHRTVAVFGSATERTIFVALKRAGKQIAADMKLAEGEALRGELDQMEKIIAADAARFGDMAQTLLSRVFDAHPVLLVLDDFEQSLAAPQAGVAVVAPDSGHLRAMAALLRALAEADTRSRLLVTSRYDFAVPDGAGKDLTRSLARAPLAPMGARERKKQIQAKARASQREKIAVADPELVARALAAAGGNPGLQDVLTTPILADEPDQAKAAIDRINAFRQEGKPPPPGDDLGDFFKRMTFEVYAAALTGTERLVLGAAAMFQDGLPAPRAAVSAAAAELGVSAPEPAIDRLLALGLLDNFGPMRGWPSLEPKPHIAANPLARPLGQAVPEADQPALAAAVLPALAEAWRNQENKFPFNIRGLEAARLALMADPADSVCLDQAAHAAGMFATHLQTEGFLAEAKCIYETKCLPAFEALSDRRSIAVTHGMIAAIIQTGNPDQARHIYEEKCLPVFEALGEELEIAITRGKIAEIIQFQGDPNVARRIYEEKCLPVFEVFGKKRETAVTYGKIAEIIQFQGDPDEARCIYEKKCLPAYEALGDRREIALTRSKIAEIIHLRDNKPDEARRIFEEECLPVFKALGDRHSIAVTHGKIADIFQNHGDLDEARRIREGEELPALEALDDKLGVAITRGKIADMLEAKGDLDDALDMQLARLPVAEQMQDANSFAHIRFSCARIRLARRDHERGGLPTIYEELSDAFAIATQMQRPNAVGAIGAVLGEVLALDGAKEQAIEVLTLAAEAFRKIGEDARLRHCENLIQMIQED